MRLKEEARTLVWHVFFSSSMDSAALTTKELDENKSMNACSGGHDACFKARAAFLEERLRLIEGKLANAEEKIGVLQLELEESILSCSDAWGDASLWRRHQKELAEDPKLRRAKMRFTPRKDDWLCLACDWRSACSVERCIMCGRLSSWCPPRPAGDEPSFVIFNRAEDHPSRGWGEVGDSADVHDLGRDSRGAGGGGGRGWGEMGDLVESYGFWRDDEAEDAGCGWDQDDDQCY